MPDLPPCGLYRTVTAIGGIDAGRLVYFHNHGDPGPGIYQPEAWSNNRARFAANGTTIPADFDPKSLKPLPAEGFYRVTAAFYCCPKQCTKFEPAAFVQLGYNGAGRALVFVPELGMHGIALPERGTLVDDAVLSNLDPLRVVEGQSTGPEIVLPRGIVVH
jgi:hypothetical protein